MKQLARVLMVMLWVSACADRPVVVPNRPFAPPSAPTPTSIVPTVPPSAVPPTVVPNGGSPTVPPALAAPSTTPVPTEQAARATAQAALPTPLPTPTPSPYRPRMSFGIGANLEVLDADGGRVLQLVSNNATQTETFTLELWQISEAQFLERWTAQQVRGYEWWWGDKNRAPYLDVTGGQLRKRWEITVPPRDALAGQREIEGWVRGGFAEAGGGNNNAFNVKLPAEMPPGFYVIRNPNDDGAPAPGAGQWDMTLQAARTSMFVVLSRNTLLVQRGASATSAWVTDINGAPVGNARVQAIGKTGSALAEAATNTQGLARLPVTARNMRDALVLARVGDDVTLAAVRNGWEHWNTCYWSCPRGIDPRDYSAHFATDRPIYKPGDTMNYKAIVRADDDAALSLPPAGISLTVRIRDSRNNLLDEQLLPLNDFGTLNSSYLIPAGAPLGDYTLELEPEASAANRSPNPGNPNRQLARHLFKVEQYIKPEFQVSVRPVLTRVLSGQPFVVTGEARTYDDAPLAGGSASFKMFRAWPAYCGEWNEDTASCKRGFDWAFEYGDEGAISTTVTLDARGRFTATLPGRKIDARQGGWWGYENEALFGVEVTVDDGSARTVSANTLMRVQVAAERIQLPQQQVWQYALSDTITITGSVLDLADRGVANRDVLAFVGLEASPTNTNRPSAQRIAMRTDATGVFTATATLTTPGWHQARIEVIDATGNMHEQNHYFFVVDNTREQHKAGAVADIGLRAENNSPNTGDTINLWIETAASGQALLVTGRGNVRREQLVTLTPPLTKVPYTVQPEDAPNVFVTAYVWQAPYRTGNTDNRWYSTNVPDSQLTSSSVELRVPMQQRELKIAIAPDKAVYAPRDKAIYEIKVTDASGAPAFAELSLALVDESVFALSDDFTKPITQAFYAPRRNGVMAYDAMALRRWLIAPGGGGGGGGFAPGNPRGNFPDTARWLPVVRTNVDGIARVEIELPDNITTWRLTAHAATRDTKVGSAVARVIVQQDVVLRPLLPTGLIDGDQVTLGALVRNASTRTHEVAVSWLSTSTLLAVDAPRTQTITLPAGGARVVNWPVRASGTGDATVLIAAEPINKGTAPDAVRATLPVRKLAVSELRQFVGALNRNDETNFDYDLSGVEGALTVQLDRSLSSALLDGAQYLIDFPYGCVEQTMSRAMPNAAVARTLRKLGVSDAGLQARLPKLMRESVARLTGFQHDDGGWGWWFDDDSSLYQSAWVVYGLASLAEGGALVDGRVISRGVEFLDRAYQAKQNEKPREHAFALHAMAASGLESVKPAVISRTRALVALEPVDAFALAHLALAAHAAGDGATARVALDALAKNITVQGDEAVVKQSSGDWRDMHSSTRDTALALMAFARILPADPSTTRLAAWLEKGRSAMDSRWGTTHDTAFVLIALSDYLLATGEAGADASVTISANGKTLEGAALTAASPAYSRTFALADAPKGTLKIAQASSGRTQVRVVQRSTSAQRALAAAGSITVTRSYTTANGTPLADLKPGDLVQVNISFALPKTGGYLHVADTLPAGLEALNERLNITSHDPGVMYGGDPWSFWGSWGYNHKEIRGNSVNFFVTYPNVNGQRLTYRARVIAPGEFSAPPAEVSAMYDPDLWGRSASEQLVVK